MQQASSIPSENLLEVLGPAVLSSIRDPFGIINSDFRILWTNKALAWIYQSEPKDAIGTHCYKTFRNRDKPCPNCSIMPVIQTGRTHVTEKQHSFPDGSLRWGEVRAYPVRGENRQLVAVVVIVIEITDKKQQINRQKQYSKYLAKKLKQNTQPDPLVTLPKSDITLRIKLSERELEILRLLTEGYTNPQMSQFLSVTTNTIKSHVNQIFNKLGVSDRTQASVMAIRHKLI